MSLISQFLIEGGVCENVDSLGAVYCKCHLGFTGIRCEISNLGTTLSPFCVTNI